VRLRSLIGEIGATYDRQLPMSSEAQMLLRQATVEFEQWIPAGYRVEGCGGRGRPAVTPSIAVLTSAETARSGLYVAYVFAADMRTVTLSLNQGVNESAGHVGRARARQTLTLEAADLRAALTSSYISDLDTTFDLRSTTQLAVDFQRANVLSRTYRLNALPDERTMVADLQRFIRLYVRALDARGRGGQPGNLASVTPVRSLPDAKPADEPEKDAGRPEPESQSPTRWVRPSAFMTRRRVLGALLALPAVFAAPTLLGRELLAEKEKQKPPPHEPAPQFTIDVSQHDWDGGGGNLDWVAVREAGIVGMCARATYGDPDGFNYPSYHFGDFVRAAQDADFPLRGGYHNLVRGDQASINRQVDWLRRELDAHDANWALLDVERYGEMVTAVAWPLWDDVRRFDDRWAAVDDRVLVGYLPAWNWTNHLGQPDLRAFRGPLIASDYPVSGAADYRQLYARCGGDNGRGWASYGNRVSEGWQFSSRAMVPGAPTACDMSAWRMSSDQLYALLIGTP
jgi:MrcB-like, N-terminal domain/Glycosyl hydrolases family 25